MDGPSHYREAERLAAAYKEAITAAEAMTSETPRQAEDRLFAAENARALLAKAKVHATLAAAAATVLDPDDLRARGAWQRVTRVPRPECEHDGCTAEQSVSWDPYCTEHKDDLKAES